MESLYREFFKNNEIKDRCFKDLYNAMEASASKFFELYSECLATN